MRCDPKVVLLSGVMLIIIGVIAWLGLRDTSLKVRAVWFYDLKTGDLFVGDASAVPPIQAPSDQSAHTRSGVLANVIQVEGDEVPRLVFLQTYTPEAQQAREQFLRNRLVSDEVKLAIVAGFLVAVPPSKKGDVPHWVKSGSVEATGVLMRVSAVSGGKPYTAHLP